MAGKSRRVSPELANHFLREVQLGNLPDVSELKQAYHFLESAQDLFMCTNRHGDTPFLMAARHGHVDLLRKLHVEYGVPLEHTNTDGKAALHEAAQNGHVGCVDYLTEAGARVDCLKRADWSVPEVNCSPDSGSLSSASSLVPSVHLTGNRLKTPLMLACTRDSKPVVERLIGHGALLSLRNKDGWTPFHIACREGHPDVISYILDVDPQCWDTKSNNGRTPLHTVALHGREEVARILLERCCYDPNLGDSCGVTPLMDAVRGDHITMTEFLLHKYGAKLEALDILGRQAIHHAAQAGALGALECIIRQGADVNKLASVNNITPLHYAAKEGQAGAISLLLQHGADPTVQDKRGRTGLTSSLGLYRSRLGYVLFFRSAALDVARNARDSQAAVKVLETVLT